MAFRPGLNAAVTGPQLYSSMMHRYLSHPIVRQWLLSRTPHLIPHASTLQSAFSYACMYYPMSYTPKGPPPYPLPKPFLDIGDFVVFHRRCDHYALGSLYNPNEHHSMANIRDLIMKGPKLSSRPRARNFAVDLRIKKLEVIEFIWMDDGSLIVACRRLHASQLVPEKPTVLSADFLFYPILHPDDALVNPPMLCVSVTERPAFCQFCGQVGTDTCRCPPNFKVRAPALLPNRSLSSFSVSPTPLSSLHSQSLQIHEKETFDNILQCWPINIECLFKIDQVGVFFFDWYRFSNTENQLIPIYSHPHPIPYQFVTGTRTETLHLASMFIKNMHYHNHIKSMDLRLKPVLQYPYDEPNQHQLLSQNETSAWLGSNTAAADPCLPDIDLDLSSSLDSNPDTIHDHELDVRPPSATFSLHDRESQNLLSVLGESSEAMGSPCTASLSTDPPAERCFNVSVELLPPLDDSSRASSFRNPTSTPLRSSTRGTALTAVDKDRLDQFLSKNVENNVTCVPCHKKFSKRSNLMRHIQTRHLGLKPFQCESCARRFGHKNHLLRHKEKLHNQVYPCPSG